MIIIFVLFRLILWVMTFYCLQWILPKKLLLPPIPIHQCLLPQPLSQNTVLQNCWVQPSQKSRWSKAEFHACLVPSVFPALLNSAITSAQNINIHVTMLLMTLQFPFWEGPNLTFPFYLEIFPCTNKQTNFTSFIIIIHYLVILTYNYWITDEQKMEEFRDLVNYIIRNGCLSFFSWN